jgi:DNA-binding transcriptional LysR family regulator
MNLDDLRIFLAVVRRGTLTAAAGEAHLSQPAITRRLQALERALGARLFEREGRRLRLTAAGAHLQRRAEAILAQVSDLPSELAGFGEGAGGRLRIGATVTSCLYLLPPVFRRFRQAHPGCQVVVRNDTSQRMGDLIHDRRIEVGVASTLIPREGVRAIPWQELELALVRPVEAQAGKPASSGSMGSQAGGRPLGSAPQSLAVLAEAPMVLPAGGTLRAVTDTLLARHEIVPRVVAECDSLEVVKALIASGFGHALLPRICLEPGEAGLEAVEVAEPLPRLPVAILVSQGRALPAPVQAFLEVLGV